MDSRIVGARVMFEDDLVEAGVAIEDGCISDGAPRRDIDARLLLGAALFGAGWGIAGVCPGPGLTSLVSGAETSLVFVSAMIIGMFAYQRLFTSGWARPRPQVAD